MMEGVANKKDNRKKKEFGVYHNSLHTRKIQSPFERIGKNIK